MLGENSSDWFNDDSNMSMKSDDFKTGLPLQDLDWSNSHDSKLDSSQQGIPLALKNMGFKSRDGKSENKGVFSRENSQISRKRPLDVSMEDTENSQPSKRKRDTAPIGFEDLLSPNSNLISPTTNLKMPSASSPILTYSSPLPKPIDKSSIEMIFSPKLNLLMDMPLFTTTTPKPKRTSYADAFSNNLTFNSKKKTNMFDLRCLKNHEPLRDDNNEGFWCFMSPNQKHEKAESTTTTESATTTTSTTTIGTNISSEEEKQQEIASPKPKQTPPKPNSNEVKIQRRLHQIQIGKDTKEYKKYIRTIPKENRKFGDPTTPDATNLSLSKRRFMGIYKAWRRELHRWD